MLVLVAARAASRYLAFHAARVRGSGRYGKLLKRRSHNRKLAQRLEAEPSSIVVLTYFDITDDQVRTQVSAYLRLHDCQVRVLYLNNNAITDRGLAHLHVPSALVNLNLGGNVSITDQGIVALAPQLGNLVQLSLCGLTRLSAASWRAIATHCGRLKCLELRRCFIQDECMEALFGEDSRLSSALQQLYLSNNLITDEGMAVLCRHAGRLRLRQLQTLTLDNNRLTDHCIRAFSAELAAVEDAEDNADEDEDTAAENVLEEEDDEASLAPLLAPLLPLMEDTSMPALQPTRELLGDLFRCTKLRELNLARNVRVGDVGALELARLLQSRPVCVRWVRFDGLSLSPAGYREIDRITSLTASAEFALVLNLLADPNCLMFAVRRTARVSAQHQQKRFFGHGHGHGEPAVFNPKDMALPAAYLGTGLLMLTTYIKCAYAKTRELDAELKEQRANGAFERDDRVLNVYKGED